VLVRNKRSKKIYAIPNSLNKTADTPLGESEERKKKNTAAFTKYKQHLALTSCEFFMREIQMVVTGVEI
jgi:hypothetical protein